MKTSNIGSVSSGTLRDQDLLRAFADELEVLTEAEPESPVFKVIAEAREVADTLDDEDVIGVFRGNALENSSAIIEDLTEYLNEIAPPFCYFGTHEGDGAEFGFWPSWDSIDDAINATDEILKVSDTSEAPEFILHINDHGNATLYRVKLKEAWAIV